MNRTKLIENRLNQAFHPAKLEVIDESAKHLGHAGAKSGAGHFAIKITSAWFEQKTKLAAHREIYAVLSDLIGPEIHALSIKIE